MTTLNKDHKFLFIHIPKNAGTSMYHVWGRTPGIDWHAPIKTLMEKWNFDDYFKFSFVRNPWDRMWSFYHHVADKHPETYEIDFNDWLVEYDDSEDRRVGQTAPWDEPVSSTKRPQLYWISNDNGKIILDFIGRFENLQRDFSFVCKRLGYEEELPHIRQRIDPTPYQEVYNEKGREHIEKYFASDIKMFGYIF